MAPNLHIFQETAVEAFPMAIVGFAVAFSVAKVYSVKHDYTIDGNQVRKQHLRYLKLTLLVDPVTDNSMLSFVCLVLFSPSNAGADSLWGQ